MFDYIFLDLDGPVLEGKNRHYQCYKEIIDQYGGKALDIDTYWNMKRTKISRDVILRDSNFQSTYENFFNAWMKNIEKPEYLTFDILKPKVRETLQTWKLLSGNIILITLRQNRNILIKQLIKLDIYDCFSEIICCSPQRINTKYEALKERKFNSAIFIGDTEEDTKTASMLNIASIGITNGLREQSLLNANYYYEEIKDIDFNCVGS